MAAQLDVAKIHAAIMAHLEGADKLRAKVGWFPGSTEEDGTPCAEAAATNEFGDPAQHIPPRPFIRPTVAEKRGEWAQKIQKGMRGVVRGQITTAEVLDAVGMTAAGDIRKAIKAVTNPPLSERTIKQRMARLSRKKITPSIVKPLIDTGTMLATLTSIVEDADD